MRKITFKFMMLIMFLLAGIWVNGQTKYNVTFKVNMNDVADFNPATDQVFISGSFAEWPKPGSVDSLKMLSGLQIKVYELTMKIDSGEIQYKYFLVKDEATWEYGEWASEDNRVVKITRDTTFVDIWGVNTSGIFDTKITAEYKMFPNPVNNVLNISDLHDVSKIMISDVSGKEIKSVNVESNHVSINTEALKSGVYFVSFYTKAGIQTSKFVKK